MTVKNNGLLNKILQIILCVSLIISGICLMAGCLSIYLSNPDEPYSRQIVAQTFGYIQIPIYISLMLIVITAFTSCKQTNKKTSVSQLLKLFSERRDISGMPELSESIKKEQKLRKKHTAIWAVINGIAAIIFLIYALNPTNYGKDINHSVINAVTFLFGCLAISLASSVFFFFFGQKSKLRELELIKKAPLKSKENENAPTQFEIKKEKRLNTVKLVLLIIFLCLAVIGFILGGTDDVLTKAVNICTECIGLG